ncbi:hypothetical protein [Streptomyces sp. CB03238]|uniref:hypothetical protein n=1 Tax=Streptomyces sp. CB03238 TaxID=1907777 RepID=UPI000A1110C0|nr:hypothetical protein [Streptomyces sp. CB03238]ORT57387.1 hypothetical protein BKD26_24310 [Streptomyces sp. CB03238]
MTAEATDYDTVPLSRLAAGDYAVLAWLDDIGTDLPADVEADLVARWDTATLRDVYELVYSTAPGAASS